MKGYPFHDGRLFARNQWYLAAWAGELGDAPLARRILGQDMVLFRAGDGVTALSGVCPHRWMPLAGAQLADGVIACPYHGARFDHRGACLGVPGQDRAPPNLRLTPYPAVLSGACVWVWPGEAGRADPADIPDTASLGLTGPGWRVDATPPVRLKARAQLLLENLFDERHINIVHSDTLGGCQADIFKDAEIADTPDRLSATCATPVVPSDPAMRAVFEDLGSHAVSRLTIELAGVCLVNNIGSQTFSTDAQGREPRAVGAMNFIHGITPETETTTHYFLAETRNFKLEDTGLSALLSHRNAQIVAEDITILEAIESVIDVHGDSRREVSLASDALGMRIRARIRRLMDQDQ